MIHRKAIIGPCGPISGHLLREILSDVLIDLRASRDLVTRMKQLFERDEFLFKESKEQLAWQITLVEEAVNRFNSISSLRAKTQGFNQSGPAWSQIDLDSVRIRARKRSEIMFDNIKAIAEADALQSLGRNQAAQKIISEFIAKNVPPSKDGAQSPPEPKAPKPPGPPLYDRVRALVDELKRAQKAKDEEGKEV